VDKVNLGKVKLYQELIVELTRCSEHEAGFVEAWMRLERGPLDSLDRATFGREARLALACVRASTLQQNQDLARSYGLMAPARGGTR
jgi:hypothetical protein